VGIKLKEALSTDDRHHSWYFVCPACNAVHQCDTRWKFNGDKAKPTFDGSVLVHAVPVTSKSVPGYKGRPRCHSQVTDGKIAYYEDSTHAFAGKTLDLPDWDFARGLGGARA
jgi:hypothetical protein